jgi:integrin-linked kinase-associated serine/threonine phosphatase 2C
MIISLPGKTNGIFF